MQQNAPMQETVDLRSYFQLLWRRKWMILIPTLIAGIAGIILTMPKILRPVYRCKATLMLELPPNMTRSLNSVVQNPGVQERLLRLESQIQSAAFLNKIIDNTGMRDDVTTLEWAERNQKKYPDMSVDELVELKLQRYLRQTIRMESRGSGNQIRVSAMDFYPDRCYQLVQSIAAGIVEANRSIQRDLVQATGDFSEMQIRDIERDLGVAESKLEAFRRRQAGRQVQSTLVGPENLSRARESQRLASTDLDRFRIESGSARQSLTGAGGDPRRVDSLLRDGEVQSQLAEATKLELQYVRETLGGPGSGNSGQATAIQISRMISNITAELSRKIGVSDSWGGSALAATEQMATAEIQSMLASARLNELDGLISRYSNRVTSAPSLSLEASELESEVARLRDLKHIFDEQSLSSELTSKLPMAMAGAMTVIDPPQQPLKPVKPKRGALIGLSFVGGLLLGVVGSFVLEHHDQTFRDVRDAETRLGVRVIGTIPTIAEIADTTSAKNETEALNAFREFLDDSPGYQEFRKTVLALLRGGEGGPKSILLTSARTAEGKSTASTCLALTLAKELPRERIVLVDMDARKPALSRRFGLETTLPSDVGEMLRTQKWSDQALQSGVLPNFCVLPMSDNNDTSELITQEKIRWLLEELFKRFDRVIIDSPPNLPVPDPLVLGPEVEAVLMVIKAGVTPRETVRRSLEMQRQFQDNVWGILMNNVGEALPYYYSYKHYGYGYGKKKARG